MCILRSMPTPKFFISLLYFFLILRRLRKLLLKCLRIIQRWIRYFLFYFWFFSCCCFSANPVNTTFTTFYLIWCRSFWRWISISLSFLLLITNIFRKFLLQTMCIWMMRRFWLIYAVLFHSIPTFFFHILAQFIKQIPFNRMIAILFRHTILRHLSYQTWLIVIVISFWVCDWFGGNLTRALWNVV